MTTLDWDTYLENIRNHGCKISCIYDDLVLWEVMGLDKAKFEDGGEGVKLRFSAKSDLEQAVESNNGTLVSEYLDKALSGNVTEEEKHARLNDCILIAARGGYSESVKECARRGADINARKDAVRRTLYMLIVETGY